MSGLRSITAFLLAALVAGPAGAQDCATAECHVERGLAARTQGDDAAATAHFEAALALERTPRILAQLALAEQALGRWIDAEAHLVEAMAADDPWIVDHRGVLEGALATIREHLGRLIVTANVEGATVRVNGRDAGALPMAEPVSVEIGTAVIDVTAPGHVAVQRQEEIAAGQLSRVRVTLVPRAGAASPDPVTSDPVTSDPDPTPDPTPAPVVEGGGPSAFLILGGVSAALTAAALVTTFVALAVREDNVLVWNDGARCPPFPDGRLVACPDAYASWRSAEDWAIAGAVASGVFAALTATFFGLAATEGGGEAAAALDLELGPGRLHLGARGRF